MKRRLFIIMLLLGCTLCVFNSFVDDNPYFRITPRDVELNIPKGFPKPLYTFKNNKLSVDVFSLGRRLFYDPILSQDSTISCASCHQRIAAFGHIDHPLSHGINGLIGKRNVSALQNLIWKDTYMWDGGVNSLETQPINPITNAVEMNETLPHVLAKLKASPKYVALFRKAYGDSLITSERLLKALTQFTGLMISADSRYDRFIAGKDTFSAAEKNGLVIFKTKCANCHAGALFTDNSYRNNGIQPDTALKDEGRFVITGLQQDLNLFKVPTLRNVERTYPYMHDGRFRSLKQVMDHYANAEKYDRGVDKSMYKIGKLSEKEKMDVIAFLKTLTDQTFLYDKRFMDPDMN